MNRYFLSVGILNIIIALLITIFPKYFNLGFIIGVNIMMIISAFREKEI
jgi:hypothetical protein